MKLGNNFVFHSFCITLLSTFIPYKVYPITFLIYFFLVLCSGVTKRNSVAALLAVLFIFYGLLVFFVIGGDAENGDLAITKLVLNGSFFVFSCLSLSLFNRNINEAHSYLIIFEKYLKVAIILSLVQVLILQLQSGGFRFSSENSYLAGLMFTEHTMFWGVQDKNMYGAKIALFGFLHAFISLRIKGKINYTYGALYLLTSALTLSRTSLLLALLTFSVLIFFKIKPYLRYLVISPILVVVGAFILPKLAVLMRLNSIANVNMDDGMGIRIMFWTAFFQRVHELPLIGSGILSASQFLGRFSATGSANNMHNLYINTYLDLGVVGLSLYLMLLISVFFSLYKYTKSIQSSFILFSPLLILTNTLYTAYDNDPWIYLSAIVIIALLISKLEKKEGNADDFQ